MRRPQQVHARRRRLDGVILLSAAERSFSSTPACRGVAQGARREVRPVKSADEEGEAMENPTRSVSGRTVSCGLVDKHLNPPSLRCRP